ncbi:MAG: MFS transporter [Dehalococcoidia bacterium]|nr:MFS transporter [Dehalococcoidia bacterium]
MRVRKAFSIPPLSKRQRGVLALVSLASLTTSYGTAIMVLALPQIQSGLSIEDAAVSDVAAVIRFGSLLAVPAVLVADRVGRRPALIFVVVANVVLTAATGAAPSMEAFATLQFLARIFHTATGIVAAVYITEEFPTDHRGWGFGALAILAGVGAGLALFMFGMIEQLPFGWRTLYFLALPALALLPLLLRGLPETQRFLSAQTQSHRSYVSSHLRPILSVATAYPGRFAALAVVILVVAISNVAAGLYGPTYLQSEHDYSPARLSTILLLTGIVGAASALYLGSLSDRFGRRRLAVLLLVASPCAMVGFYEASGTLLPVLLVTFALVGTGADVSLAAMGKELFPTSYRSTVSGFVAMVAATGGVIGLWTHGRLFDLIGDQWTAVSALAALGLLAPFILAFTLPETNRRALEEISPER